MQMPYVVSRRVENPQENKNLLSLACIPTTIVGGCLLLYLICNPVQL